MPTRLDALRSALTAQDPAIDALLLTDNGNLSYITGFTGSTAQALITPDEALFITDSRYTLRAQAECDGFEIVETPAGSGGYGEALKNVLSARPALRRMGFEAGQVTVSQFDTFRALVPEMEWIATADLVETLRLVKDADEIARIKAAIVVAETAMETV
ncbi:MAG: aminopeptidase P family N-terminal domain-containing protein, partial [Janthinobacterium lividum]